MKNFKPLYIISLLLLIFSSCFLLGCGGCATQDKTSEKTNDSSSNVQWNLSANATTTYLFLLYDQSLRQDDRATLVYALKELANFNPPVTVYIEAGILFMDGDPAPIIPILQEGLQKYPDNISLNLLNAELLQKAGQSAEAIKRIRAFGKRHPKNIDAKLELALLLVNSNQHAEAEGILHNITGAERTALVEYYHARALIGMNRSSEAVPYLEKAIIEMPSFTEALIAIANIYEQENKLEQACDIYEKIIDNQGYNPEVLLRLVHISLRLNEPERALEYYEEGPITPVISATIASMLVESAYYDLAEPILQKLLTLPDAPQELFFYLAAISYERDKNPQKTYDFLSNIKDNHADYTKALLLRLQLLIDMEKYKEALNLSAIGKDADPNKKEFQLAEIRLLATLERMDEAIDSSSELMKKLPDDVEIAFLHASLLDENGDKDEAFKVMENIIKTNPEHYQALNYIGYTLAEENRELKRALELLRKAVSLSPNSDYILDSLAWVLYKSKQFDEAWEIISKVVTMSQPRDPVIWEHYGDIAKALGKKIEARKGYENALELKPNNADDLRRRISNL